MTRTHNGRTFVHLTSEFVAQYYAFMEQLSTFELEHRILVKTDAIRAQVHTITQAEYRHNDDESPSSDTHEYIAPGTLARLGALQESLTIVLDVYSRKLQTYEIIG